MAVSGFMKSAAVAFLLCLFMSSSFSGSGFGSVVQYIWYHVKFFFFWVIRLDQTLHNLSVFQFFLNQIIEELPLFLFYLFLGCLWAGQSQAVACSSLTYLLVALIFRPGYSPPSDSYIAEHICLYIHWCETVAKHKIVQLQARKLGQVVIVQLKSQGVRPVMCGA